MTQFEKDVLKEVIQIPFGQLCTYKWVANALGKNPYPLAIPCHRVIKSSGEFGGYVYGKLEKEKLIKLEKKIKDVLKYKSQKEGK